MKKTKKDKELDAILIMQREYEKLKDKYEALEVAYNLLREELEELREPYPEEKNIFYR